MRRVKSPPRRLRLASTYSLTPSGTIRKWASTKATKNFRLSLSLWLRKKQRYRCSYCLLLTGEKGRRSHHLDHFVPKGPKTGKPQWTFEILNLIFTCEYCNTKKKKTYNPLTFSAANYRRCQFSIVHPYLDTPDLHYRGGYIREDLPPTVPEGISAKGRESIKLFGLASPTIQELWQQNYESIALRSSQAALPSDAKDDMTQILNEIS